MDSIIIYIILFIVIGVLVLSIINYINTKKHIKECDYHNRLMTEHFRNLKFYFQEMNALHDRVDGMKAVLQGLSHEAKGVRIITNRLLDEFKNPHDIKGDAEIHEPLNTLDDKGVLIKTKEIVKVANCVPVSAELSYTFTDAENLNRDVVYAELYSMLIEELRPYVKFGECEDFFHRVKTYTAEINIDNKINNTRW